MNAAYVIRIERLSNESKSTRIVELSCDSSQTVVVRETTGYFPVPREEYRDSPRIYRGVIRSLTRWRLWEQEDFASEGQFTDGVVYDFIVTQQGKPEAKLCLVNPYWTAPRSIQKLERLADRLLDSPWLLLRLRGFIGFDTHIPFN